MLEAGIRYPSQGDWINRILIGGLLTMFSFLIIPILIVYGYLLRVLKASYDGQEEPPAWGDWGTLLVKGFVAWLISIAYSIPLILFAVLMIPIIGVGAIQDDIGAVAVGTGIIWLLGTVVLALLIAYVLPAALTAYARADQVGAAFDFASIKDIAFTGEYFIAVVMALVVSIVVGIITSILSVTLIGLILVPFIGFYGSMAMANIVATGVRKASTV